MIRQENLQESQTVGGKSASKKAWAAAQFARRP